MAKGEPELAVLYRAQSVIYSLWCGPYNNATGLVSRSPGETEGLGRERSAQSQAAMTRLGLNGVCKPPDLHSAPHTREASGKGVN